jgi:hypothetical protein
VQTALHRSASPGRLAAFEEELFKGGEGGDAPLVAAVALGYADGQRVVGAAYLDPGSRWVGVGGALGQGWGSGDRDGGNLSTGANVRRPSRPSHLPTCSSRPNWSSPAPRPTQRRLGACQFVDDEHFCSLETLLVQLGAREVVVQAAKGPDGAGDKGGAAGAPDKPAGGALGAAGAAADRRRLGDVLDRVGAMASDRARTLFAAKHLEQDLAKLLKVGGWGGGLGGAGGGAGD